MIHTFNLIVQIIYSSLIQSNCYSTDLFAHALKTVMLKSTNKGEINKNKDNPTKFL